MFAPEKGFTTVTIGTPDGPVEMIAERTESPHLVINPAHNAETEDGFQGFGFWMLTHVPTGYAIPTKHEHNLETVRWMASEFAKSDIDWTSTPEEFGPVVIPLLRDMIEKADEEDQANTPPGELSRSTLRRICEGNARALAAQGNS
jgi:hypothetical protein